MSEPLPLVVTDVRIRHDQRDAYTPDGVGFSVRPGEVVLLLGPSGSGKSTLALALNGLIPHAVPADLEGTVFVAGFDTSTETVARLSEHVGMVFQDPDAQVVTGTVLDEVCFGPENQLVAKATVLECAELALRQVGLWERRTENPDRLSGGGRQRLAIACALALRPAIIVLDEPTANLDPVGIREVYAVLAELVAAGQMSVVLIEHNLDAAMAIVDRVVVLDAAGRLAIDGPARDVMTGDTQRLIDLGVWLPVATIAALRLRAAGVAVEPLPMTPAELAGALDSLTSLPEVLDESATIDPFPSRTSGNGTSGNGTSRNDVVISVTDLTVTKRATEILRGIDLEVGRGDFLAIVGTNGAGKTTLLQAIAGVVAPPKGRISVNGIDPSTADVRELARTVGFVFQNPEHQFVRHTVAEELAHGLEIQRLPSDEIEERVGRMLARFGLEEHRHVHPFLLSGGQKRRLSVGTAIIAGAPVLALDEPTFGQDRERAAELLDMLTRLNEAGTTVIVVTHDMQLVADHASHVAVLADGQLVEFGTASRVLAGDALAHAGLLPPPLSQAMRSLTRHPEWRGIARIADLPAAVRA